LDFIEESRTQSQLEKCAKKCKSVTTIEEVCPNTKINETELFEEVMISKKAITVDSRLSARGLTALQLNRGNVFLKKKFYFP
jgi:hypothetical protein